MSNGRRHRRGTGHKPRIVRATYVDDPVELERRFTACGCPIGIWQANGSPVIAHLHEHRCAELIKIKAGQSR